MIDKARAGFLYRFEFFDKSGLLLSRQTVHNLLPSESIDYILGAALDGDSQFSSWYLGLYSASHTPAAADTMTTMVSTVGEVTAYDSATRPAMTPDAIASGVFSNVGAPTEFTFTGSATVYGGFITSNSTKSNTTGLLLSVVALPSPQVMASTGVLRVTAGLSLASL